MDSERPSFPVGVNVMVIRDGKLLLGLRKNVFGDGTWGLPGGHLEDRENMKGAAARELLEETGLNASGFVFCNLVNNVQRERHYLQVGFVAEGVSGEVKLMEPDKCAEWRWFNLDDLPESIFPGHEKQIELYKSDEKFTDH